MRDYEHCGICKQYIGNGNVKFNQNRPVDIYGEPLNWCDLGFGRPNYRVVLKNNGGAELTPWVHEKCCDLCQKDSPCQFRKL